MIAKWSEIFVLSKMRLFGFTQPLLSIALRERRIAAFADDSVSSVFLTVREVVLRQGARSRSADRSAPCASRRALARATSVVLRREAEAAVGFALQARQVEEQRRELASTGFVSSLTMPVFAAARARRCASASAAAPQALGLALGVVVLLEMPDRTSAPGTRRPWRRSARALPSSRAA